MTRRKSEPQAPPAKKRKKVSSLEPWWKGRPRFPGAHTLGVPFKMGSVERWIRLW
jgi:hypothetical protein